MSTRREFIPLENNSELTGSELSSHKDKKNKFNKSIKKSGRMLTAGAGVLMMATGALAENPVDKQEKIAKQDIQVSPDINKPLTMKELHNRIFNNPLPKGKVSITGGKYPYKPKPKEKQETTKKQ